MLDQTTVIPYSIESHDDTPGSSERAEVSQSTESVSQGERKDLKHLCDLILLMLTQRQALHNPVAIHLYDTIQCPR